MEKHAKYDKEKDYMIRRLTHLGYISFSLKQWNEQEWISSVDCKFSRKSIPDSKVHGANMGHIWGRQIPGGPHVGLANFAIWDVLFVFEKKSFSNIYM